MTASAISTQGLKPPRQRRSAKTLADILVATMHLLEEKDLQEISVADIAQRADVSVGTIYTRFADKDALFAYLIVELLKKQVETFRTLFEESAWTGVSLERRVLHFARLLVTSANLQPGVQRAITIRTVLGQGAPTDEEGTLRDESRALTERWLLGCRAEIKNPRPEQAVRFTLSLAVWGVHNLVLFRTDPNGLLGDNLAEEIARAMLAYLQCDVSLPADAPPLRWPGAGFAEFPNLTSGP